MNNYVLILSYAFFSDDALEIDEIPLFAFRKKEECQKFMDENKIGQGFEFDRQAVMKYNPDDENIDNLNGHYRFFTRPIDFFPIFAG